MNFEPSEAPPQSSHGGLEQRADERATALTAANEELKTKIAECGRTEALLDGQMRVLEMIAAGAPLKDSLTALVRLIEEQAPGILGSILLIDRLKRHFCGGVAPSLPPEYVSAIYGLPIGPAAGSCGTAAFRKESVVVKDIATDPLWKDYRDLALLHGLRACWSTPILSAQRELLGTFAMYYREPALPEPEHWRLVVAATHVASIAIGNDLSQCALRESEAKLKEAQRIGNIGYWERDLINDRITWPKETRRIFGLPPNFGPISQNKLQELIHPEDRQLQMQALNDAIQKCKPYDVEYRIVRSDGEARSVHVRDEIECDDSGRPIRMFGTVQDITERRQAEELLNAREREIRAIVEHSPDPIVRFDRDMRRTYVNPAFISANGGSAEALLGRKVGSTASDGAVNATAEEVEILQRSLKTVFDTGRPLDFEATWPLPPGRRCYAIHLEPEFDARGNLASILSIGRDITERKRAEESVRESHQLLQQVLATLPVGVAVTNQAGDIVLKNAESKRIWGEMIPGGRERWAQSKGIWHETGKRIAPVDWASVRALTRGETSINEVVDIETHDGRQKIIRNSAAPIRDGEERIVGAVIVNEDITEQKKSEERLHETELELARTARLTIMGELTASIAHEINQPLAAVVTNASAALRWLDVSPPNLDEARQAVQRIASDGNRASEVIQRIRALIKKSAPARKPVNLNELIRETVALIQPELKRQKISLKTKLAPELPLVPADLVQVQQVLLNLIVNAIDSLSVVTERQRALHIVTNRGEPDTVEVAVKDTGVGINLHEDERVFEPFYTTKPGGLGMGLAISRSIVEAHGGRLWATPNSGHGAVFQFILPVHGGHES
jgi:PAS domain S-box-containing protein